MYFVESGPGLLAGTVSPEPRCQSNETGDQSNIYQKTCVIAASGTTANCNGAKRFDTCSPYTGDSIKASMCRAFSHNPHFQSISQNVNTGQNAVQPQ